MPVLEAERDYSPTPIQTAEIAIPQPTVVPEIFAKAFVQKIEVSPFLPKNSPLEQAGFLLRRQMFNFIEGLNKGGVNEATAELTAEIRAHANEYTRERPLLVGNVKRTDRIRNTYNNEPVTDHLDWQERDGATARGSLNLEKKVLAAEQEESAGQMSPLGWNGVYPDYEKSQFVYYRVKDGSSGDLEQYTFVLNFKMEDCLRVLEKMGAGRADLICADNRQTIKNMAGQSVPLGNRGPMEVLSIFKEEKPNDPVLKVIERDLNRLEGGEDISVLPPVCEQFIQDLQGFILENAGRLYDFAFQAKVQDAIEETIYKIAEYIRGSSLQTPPVIMTSMGRASSGAKDIYSSPLEVVQNDRNWRDKYQAVIEDLRQISGCAGGGKGFRGFRFGQIVIEGSDFFSLAEKDEYGSLEFACSKCNRVNVRPKGQLIKNCQHCRADIGC